MRMETSGTNADAHRGISLPGISNGSYGVQLSASNLLRSPLSTLLEYSGLLRPLSSNSESANLITNGAAVTYRDQFHPRLDDSGASLATAGDAGQVAIRIIAATEQEHDRVGAELSTTAAGPFREVGEQNEVFVQPISRTGSAVSVLSAVEGLTDLGRDRGTGEASQAGSGSSEMEATDGVGSNNRDSSYQRYGIQQAAGWIEQVLPFALLLLVVFIRQHLQGFFVTILLAAVMFKSNDIVKKQTALKGDRKILVLVCTSLLFTVHVIGIYWWYRKDDLLYPLLMLPPKTIPPFWHVIFIIMVNDTLVRQAAMVFKCFLLMYYKNSRGSNCRRQVQMLTMVEYLLLLYRALLPAPVWYRFFLNKEYGSLFSSLMTGLYLTFKLTSVVEKVQSFFTAFKTLSCKEIHYGAYATSEQVSAAGDLCAICQEKMHAPILLHCKHIFCEDCVSEWDMQNKLRLHITCWPNTLNRFERERTCPLCRALVKSADLKSFADGSTSLFYQLF